MGRPIKTNGIVQLSPEERRCANRIRTWTNNQTGEELRHAALVDRLAAENHVSKRTARYLLDIRLDGLLDLVRDGEMSIPMYLDIRRAGLLDLVGTKDCEGNLLTPSLLATVAPHDLKAARAD